MRNLRNDRSDKETALGKITRRISIDKWCRRTAEKRGGSKITLALDELDECIPTKRSVEEKVELAELAKVIDRFVMSLPPPYSAGSLSVGIGILI